MTTSSSKQATLDWTFLLVASSGTNIVIDMNRFIRSKNLEETSEEKTWLLQNMHVFIVMKMMMSRRSHQKEKKMSPQMFKTQFLNMKIKMIFCFHTFTGSVWWLWIISSHEYFLLMITSLLSHDQRSDEQIY